MPIRINLLAEAIAAEEARRKDPVKRATFVAAFLVFCVVLWAATLQLKIISAKNELGTLESRWKSIETNYKSTVDAQKASLDTDRRLAALHQMATNRLLWGNVLNAFQQTLIDGVQVVKFRTEQTYAYGDGTPNRTNGTNIVQGKPPTSTERITMTIDAMDSSSQPGSRVNKFKESIATNSFFKAHLTRTNGVMLLSRSAPQNNASGNQTFVLFSLKATLPENTR